MTRRPGSPRALRSPRPTRLLLAGLAVAGSGLTGGLPPHPPVVGAAGTAVAAAGSADRPAGPGAPAGGLGPAAAPLGRFLVKAQHGVPPRLTSLRRPAPRAARGARGRTGDRPAVAASFAGEASWYGPGFQGRPTASGEPYDTGRLTGAHRTLPLGTWLRVCRGSRCVVVRINDRGPYVGQRVLDLSRAAARALGYSGTAWVTATPVRPAPSAG